MQTVDFCSSVDNSKGWKVACGHSSSNSYRGKRSRAIDLNGFLISLNGLDLIHIDAQILGQLSERRPTAFLLTFRVAGRISLSPRVYKLVPFFAPPLANRHFYVRPSKKKIHPSPERAVAAAWLSERLAREKDLFTSREGRMESHMWMFLRGSL
jgi:hypothetical protein